MFFPFCKHGGRGVGIHPPQAAVPCPLNPFEWIYKTKKHIFSDVFFCCLVLTKKMR